MRNCSECDAEIAKPKSGRFPLSCSPECKKAREARLRKQVTRYDKRCKVCDGEFIAKNSRAVFCSVKCKNANVYAQVKARREKLREERSHFVEAPCYHCGKPLTKLATQSGKISHPYCREQRKRDWNRQKNAKRRRYRYIAHSRFQEIAERDQWTCHLCNEWIDDSLPSMAKMGASLDHVIPLSKGGDDSPENLKLAHWICNVRKGNQIAQPA